MSTPDSYAHQVHDRYLVSVQAMRAITDAAAEEARELTPEENEQLERIDADIQRYSDEEKKHLDREDRAKAADETREVFAPILAKVEKSGQVAPDALRLAKLFSDYRDTGFTGGFDSVLTPDFVRALQSEGGSAIPTTFFEEVTVYERTMSPMLDPGVVTILNVSDGRPITLPRLTADPSVSGTVTAEAAGITEADPTISSIQLNAYKYAVITLWSSELGQDNVIGLDSLIAESCARELANDIGTALTTGDGSDDPNGFITAATNGGTASGTANNTFFGPSDVIDLFYSRAAPYRREGVWQASNTGLAKVRKHQDSNGQYIWQPSMIPGQPEMLLGRPIYENPAMAAAASASKSIAFGDFKKYFVQRVTPMRVELSKDYKFSTDELALKTVERVDGDLVDVAAVAFLVSAVA